ncbi:MAG: lamin tail domain-containing protein [Verrucomicrobiota bacterium]
MATSKPGRAFGMRPKPAIRSTAYQKAQGNNPDGTPNPDYEVLLDVDNLIDYMLVILYGGNLDAPISNFLGNTSPNNFFALRNRTARQGFQFFAHDSEHTLLDRTQNRIGPYSAGNTLDKSNPQWIWQQCWANAEFRVRVGDHVQRHFFNDGLFTPAGASNLFSKRKLQLDRAVVGESARWGDSKRSTPRTRDVEWIAEVNRILTDYMPQRTATVLGQLRTKSLYPTLAAPAFSQHGGFVPANFQLSASAPAGTVYYTTDGSDPRLMGGAISPRAARYSGPVRLTESTTVKSRAWDGASWSALNEAEFVLIQTFTELAITEIMFNPPGQTNVDGDEFEFVELKNVGAGELDLSGVHFASGIDYLFPSGTKLSPGGFVVLVSNRDAFAAKYPGVRIDGVYSGRLSNSGETLALVHAVGTPIFSVAYGDAVPWPLAADGQGFSIVPVNPNLNPDPNNPLNWRGSSRVGGSPGADDTPLNIQPVWINEILTHTDPPDVDQIELFNPGPEPAAIGNWFLTDARAEAKRYRIPPGTVIPPGGYKLFSEEEFSAPNGSSSGFRLNAHGEEVYLFSADAAGNLTGFSDGFSFGAAPNGVTFGRYINSIGEIQHPLQRSRTLGAPNSGPAVGPVVINEINYHPGGEEEEFVELKNITSSAVKLYDVERPTNSWRLAGVGFDFPPNNEIPPNGLALIVGTEPSVFRARHAVPAGVPVFGPYPGALQDSGELLELARPDVPEIDTNGVAFVPFIAVDGVRYNDKAPWPTNAAGAGASLERLNPLAYGNDPANWRASFATPSPGLENDGNRPPRVNAGVDRSFQANSFPLSTNLSGTVSDDGQPNPPGALTTVWTQTSGPAPAGLSAPGSTATGVTFPTVGTYVFRLTANDGGLQSSDDVSVTIERPPAEVTFVAAGSVWKYLDNGTDQGALWRTPEFDDQSWASGAAELGYGDASEGRPEKTVISFGPNGSDKYPTYYFRQAFNVGNSAAVKQLTLHLVRDDGAIVYLNGIEVFRDNLAGGEITFSTYANSAIGNDAESTFLESPVSPSVLREGRNVVAVEIHQSSGSSSDLSFDFALTGQAQPENQAPVVNAGADLSLAVNQTVALEGAVLDDGLPSPPGQVTVAWTKVSGPGDVTFGNPASAVTTLQVSAAGVYVLRLSGSDSVLSGQDDMTATAGGDPFADWKATYFGAAELADPTVSGDSADPDGDGHANAQEFVTGTNPKDAQSVLRAEVVEWTGAEGAPVKIQFRAMPEKSYTVQAQEFPGSQWIKVADVPPQPSAQQVEVRDANPNVLAAKLYRIVTPQQP